MYIRISDNEEITKPSELIHYIKEWNLTSYTGYDETQPRAMIESTKQPFRILMISYDDIWDCKKTEQRIKPYMTKFTPRKYGFNSSTSIAISYSAKQELKKLKNDGDSFDFIIWKLLLRYYDKL